MATRVVYDCDWCKTRNVEARRMYVTVDRRSDAAGSMDDIDKELDLCTDCLAKALREFLGRLGYPAASEWWLKHGGGT